MIFYRFISKVIQFPCITTVGKSDFDSKICDQYNVRGYISLMPLHLRDTETNAANGSVLCEEQNESCRIFDRLFRILSLIRFPADLSCSKSRLCCTAQNAGV